jgi:IS605 OrfB family transposase
MRLTNGSSTELGLHAHTIQRVCRTYADSRFRQKKAWLRWRGRKSLGWVPFNTGHVSFDGSTFKFNGVRYEAMHARDLLSPGMKFGAGSFCSDSKGRWYINLPIEVECSPNDGGGSVGIDLGLKSLATLSSGEKIKAPKFYRKSERAIADAQRARKSKRAKALHQKIKNRRRDFLHKHALAIAKKNSLIVVGGIEPINLAKTHMSKSMHDVGWSDFKNMLAYKAIRHGGRMIEVNEAFTSQTCSECGSLPPSRPRGIAGLGIREWVCDECGAVHDRDVNAARNILRIGLNTLVGGAHD